MTLLVNGAETPVRNGWETWGDVIQGLDEDLGNTKHVLTAVRLDGVDQPSFRSADLCAKPVASLSSIEIQTAEPSQIARQSLAEAAMALSELADASQILADALRLTDVSPAIRDLELLTQSLLTVFQVVAATSGPLETEFRALEQQGLSLNQLTKTLDDQARELIEAQQSGDWLRLSEALEYDVQPALRRWRDALLLVATS